LREITDDGMDYTKKSFNVTEEIRNLQRDIQGYEDSVVKYLSLRKARALSVLESRALKGDLQKLSLMINEIGAEIEYSRKTQAQDNLEYDDLLQTTDNISVDYEEKDGIVVGPITSKFIYRLNRNILSNNDLHLKKEYLERERFLNNEATCSDTVVNNWSMGEIRLGNFENKDVAIKTMTKPSIVDSKNGSKSSSKNYKENQRRILENEILTLTFLNKSPLFLQCYGCLMKESSSSMDLVLEYSLIGSLEDVLFDETNFPTFPLNLKFGWISDLSEALQFLYNQNIIHGDIQAKNLFLFDKMKLKLGNFHMMRSTLLPVEENISNNNISPTKAPRLGENGYNPLRNSKERPEIKTNLLLRDPSLPFLPLEARTAGKEIDISFDVFSFAMTVIQILTREMPQTDNFQQQIVQALHVSGLNLMDIRNRLFNLLTECVFDPASEPKNTRPTGDRVVEEMRAVLSALGGDPRANQSQSNFINNLEIMALEKRKQLREIHRKKALAPVPPAIKGFLMGKPITSTSFEDTEEEIQEVTDFQSSSGSVHSSLSTIRSSSGEEDRGLVPERQEINQMEEEECFEMTVSHHGMIELLNGSDNPMRMSNNSKKLGEPPAQQHSSTSTDNPIASMTNYNKKFTRPVMQPHSLVTSNVSSTSTDSPIAAISMRMNHIKTFKAPSVQPQSLVNSKVSPTSVNSLITPISTNNNKFRGLSVQPQSLVTSNVSSTSADSPMTSISTNNNKLRGPPMHPPQSWLAPNISSTSTDSQITAASENNISVHLFPSRSQRNNMIPQSRSLDFYNDMTSPRIQRVDSSKSHKSTIKFYEPSVAGSVHSYRSVDVETKPTLINFLRERVKCTLSFAERASDVMVKNGILDVEILKRRLHRDRELLIKLGLDEELAEDIYEVVIAPAAQVPLPRFMSQSTLMTKLTNGKMQYSQRNDKHRMAATRSLTYCKTEQQAAEIASLYYDASQRNVVEALNQLKAIAATSEDQLAEGFLMRIIALGQCNEPRDMEKAKKMGKKLYTWLQLMVESDSSELKSIYARYLLAVCHSEGLGVEKDSVIATEYYKESAERGYAGAQAYLGFCYYMGIGVEKNLVEAVRWYRIAADQGFSGAQSNLGICYEHGHGVARNLELASKQYQLSAQQGGVAAQYNLGNLYESGHAPIEQNFYYAAKWYLQAAVQGYTPAEYSLGCLYLLGLGVEKDSDLGIEYISRAAEKNYILAQVKLGECYEQGNGVAKNPIKAIKWYYKAAENGNAEALYYIGYYHFYGITVERDLSKAVEFYTLAAERGHAVAQNNLAICYQNGFGVQKDLTLCIKWFQESANTGFSQAQFNLGVCYEKGQGIVKSVQEAIRYYRLSAGNHNSSAKHALQRLESQSPLQFEKHPSKYYLKVDR
jgi:TPR repeat protein